MIGAFLKELSPIANDPGQFLTRLNHDLTSILRQTGSLIFVTAAYIVIDVPRSQIRYAQAGHPAPLRTEQALGTIRPVSCPESTAGPALGLVTDFEYIATEESIASGDRVLMFTDGVTEAPARDGEEFGLGRLSNLLKLQRSNPLNEVLDSLVSEISAFAGSSLPDDVCIVGIELILNK